MHTPTQSDAESSSLLVLLNRLDGRDGFTMLLVLVVVSALSVAVVRFSR